MKRFILALAMIVALALPDVGFGCPPPPAPGHDGPPSGDGPGCDDDQGEDNNDQGEDNNDQGEDDDDQGEDEDGGCHHHHPPKGQDVVSDDVVM